MLTLDPFSPDDLEKLITDTLDMAELADVRGYNLWAERLRLLVKTIKQLNERQRSFSELSDEHKAALEKMRVLPYPDCSGLSLIVQPGSRLDPILRRERDNK